MPDTPPEGIYLDDVPVRDLAPGDIIYSVGRLLHLTGKTGHVCGYDHWSYRRYGPEARAGETHLRADGEARIVRGLPAPAVAS